MAEEKPLIDEKEDATYLARYRANIIFILNDVSIQLEPQNILCIEKVDNFEFDIRPTIRLKLQLDTRKYLWLMNNKKDVKCKFELSSVKVNTQDEEAISTGAIIWNSTFNIFFSETELDEERNAMEFGMNSTTGSQSPLNDLEDDSYWDRTIVDLYLIESKSLKCSKTKVNKVFTSENLQNILCKIFNDAGQSNVYMSKLDNQTTYSNFCVPDLPLGKALAYLDLYYGFYTCGAQIYYDVDKLFIIKLNGKCTAKVKDEWDQTVFLVTNRNMAIPGNGMVIKPEQKVYYISITEENFAPEDPSLMTSVTDGSVAKIIGSDGSVKEIKAGTDAVGDTQFIKYTKNTDNKYWSSMIQARMEENTCIEKITVENADLRAFALNKAIKLVFEEPQKQKLYGSNRYRISYATHTILAESDQFMRCKSNIVLKKCSDA